jgi:hypothetical protein
VVGIEIKQVNAKTIKNIFQDFEFNNKNSVITRENIDKTERLFKQK